MVLNMFKSTTSVTKLINNGLTSNKPLKKEYKDFEKRAQALDVNSLKDIGVILRVNNELSNNDTTKFLNSQLMSIILAMATVHPYGRIAYTSLAAISLATDVIPTIKQQVETNNLKSIVKAFNDFEEWPNIYDYKKMRFLDSFKLSEEVDTLFLGLPLIIIELLQDQIFYSNEPIAEDFLFHVENGFSNKAMDELINNVTDADAINIYGETLDLIRGYSDIEEVRHDLTVMEEHLDKYPDPDDTYNIRLYKVVYDMLYRVAYSSDLYNTYIEAYSKLTGESSNTNDYAFYKVALKEGYKEFIALAPITSYDLHILSNKTDSSETSHLVLKSVISRSSRISNLTPQDKSAIIDEYERIKDVETEDVALRRVQKEVINIYRRLEVEMGGI